MKPVTNHTASLISLALCVLITYVALAVPAAAAIETQQLDANDLAVVNPGGPCQEEVHLTGTVHLVTDVRRQEAGQADITVDMNLADVQGEGKFTGAKYLAPGAAQMDFAQQSLPTTIEGVATFAWIPLGPCRLLSPQEAHLRVPFKLAVDAAGNLTQVDFPSIGAF